MTEEVIEKTTSSEDTIKAAPSKGSGGMWIGIVVLLTVALVAGGGFYFYQLLRSQGDDITREDQRNIEISKQITNFQSQLASMQEQLRDATSTISHADERFEDKLMERAKAQEEKLETSHQELTTAILHIQRQLGKTRGDWLLADAEYLLSVAGQRLHLVGDVETTREALEAADQRLRESGDAGAIKIREQIAKELAELRAVPELDLVGMYSKLNSLSERANQLTLFLPYEGKPKVKSSEHDKHTASSETSSNLLNAVLNKFDNYVTVRHTEQPITAILTAEQAQFIKQQLALKLEMIKVALIQKNQTLYHASLADALEWTDKNFNKNGETQRFMSELQQLDNVKLNAQMPDISLSLKMLRDITKLRVETDKALPAVELELKTNKTKTEETIKPDRIETEAANPVSEVAPNTKPASSEAKPEKTSEPAAQPVQANKETENKASEAKPADKTAAVNAPSNVTPATSSEPKKAVDDNVSADKPAVKTESAPKSAEKPATAPIVTKPVVAH